NNVGYLGMCGHGTIGLIETLHYLNRISPGIHIIETTAGDVSVKLDEDGTVTISNVHSYRHAANVEVNVDGYGVVRGDIAYGGNWFFLISDPPYDIELQNLSKLSAFSIKVQEALSAQG